MTWPPDPETYDNRDPDILTFKGAMAYTGFGRSQLQRLLANHRDEFAFMWGGQLRISRRRLNGVMLRLFEARKGIGD